jgi:hypothetical protein
MTASIFDRRIARPPDKNAAIAQTKQTTDHTDFTDRVECCHGKARNSNSSVRSVKSVVHSEALQVALECRRDRQSAVLAPRSAGSARRATVYILAPMMPEAATPFS